MTPVFFPPALGLFRGLVAVSRVHGISAASHTNLRIAPSGSFDSSNSSAPTYDLDARVHSIGFLGKITKRRFAVATGAIPACLNLSADGMLTMNEDAERPEGAESLTVSAKNTWGHRALLPLTIDFVAMPMTALTFTPLGASGRAGPTADRIAAERSYKGLVGTGSFPGYQTFVVPAGACSITCRGGRGGDLKGAAGATVTADFEFPEGGVRIVVIVGQSGMRGNSGTITGGGGGGSFVYDETFSRLLVCAAGGNGDNYRVDPSSPTRLSLPPEAPSLAGNDSWYQTGSGFNVSSTNTISARNFGDGFEGSVGVDITGVGYGMGGFGGGGAGGNYFGSMGGGGGGGYVGGMGDRLERRTPATSYVDASVATAYSLVESQNIEGGDGFVIVSWRR